MPASDVATSLRLPAEWLSRADVLARRLPAIPDFTAFLGRNPSRSATLRLAMFRGLVSLEALVSTDGYGPWFDLDGVYARHNSAGLWFVRIAPRGNQFEVSSNRNGLVYVEAWEGDVESAKARGDAAVRRLSAEGVFPSVLPERAPVPTQGIRREVTHRLEETAAQILDEIDDAPDYIANLLLRHEAEWKGAWNDLRRAGWTRVEVRVAVSGLREHSLVNDMRGWRFHDVVPHVLAKAEGDAATANVSPARWQKLVDSAAEHQIADHLLVLSREIALGNSRAQTRIQASTRLAWGRRGIGEVVMVTIDSDDPSKLDALKRIHALSGTDPVFVEHGPYILQDDALQVALALKSPDTDQGRVALMITEALELRSASWFR